MSDTPETDAKSFIAFDTEGRKLVVVLATTSESFERERDEAQAALTDIHRWIERNHPDGFIDSLTFHQNLERVADRWYDRLDYDRLDNVERERDEAREEVNEQKNRATYNLDLAKRARDFWEKCEKERDEAREQIKELVYIAERAIALAEIDFENDKFGVVSELRDTLMSIKMSTSK